ncbi:hypothetical protein MMC14_010365 [Varicellaria rhodocarpa]|nr:hypothetical protein [Varicellaria rhodocarpa]
MQLFPIILALAIWAFATPPVVRAVPHEFQERAACNQDNVLRALLANSADATGFCSTYINIKDATATVLGTNYPPTPITETTATHTLTAYTYPPTYLPYVLPTYLFSYPTPSRISSACSCLSIKPSTYTDYEYYSTPTATTITTTTTTALVTGPCATQTLYPGAYKLTSPPSPSNNNDTFEYSIGGPSQQDTYPNFSVSNCCSACSAFNPFPNAQGGLVQGFFGNCIGFRVEGSGECTLLLQGSVGAGYLGGKCEVDGYQPGVLNVDGKRYPYAVGGRGQCASSFGVVAS